MTISRSWTRIGLAVIALASSAVLAQKQSLRPRDPVSARALLDEAIEVLSTRPLGHEKLDWKSVRKELEGTLGPDASTAAAHAAISAAVAKLNDPHAKFTPPPELQPPQPAPTKPSSAPPEASPRPAIPSTPEGRMLDDQIAYLVVPGCAAPDVRGLRAYARAAAAEVHRLSESKPKAWVIDLRLNGGGNVWPMLLGLRPLLGDGPCMTMIKGDQIESRFGVDSTGSWIDWGNAKGREAQLGWGGTAPTTIAPISERIAILLGPWTMSSGESLAISLAGRENTRTFGEKTAGLTTVTNYFALADGSVLNLPVAWMGDRRGRAVTGPIEPAETVSFGDWPSPDDAAARAARAWALQK